MKLNRSAAALVVAAVAFTGSTIALGGGDVASAAPIAAATQHCSYTTTGVKSGQVGGFPRGPLVFGSPKITLTATYSGPGVYHHRSDGEGNFAPAAYITITDKATFPPYPVVEYRWTQSPLRSGMKARVTLYAINNALPYNGSIKQARRFKGDNYVPGHVYLIQGGAGEASQPADPPPCVFRTQAFRVEAASKVLSLSASRQGELVKFHATVGVFTFEPGRYVAHAERVQLFRVDRSTLKYQPLGAPITTNVNGTIDYTVKDARAASYVLRVVGSSQTAKSQSVAIKK